MKIEGDEGQMEKRSKSITLSLPMFEALRCICERKGLTDQAFIITAIDEKIQREKKHYTEKGECQNVEE